MNILKDEEFPKKIKEIADYLNERIHKGEFAGCGKKKLYYEYFLCEHAKGTIVIVHGLSEFIKKYYELIYYFLQQNYDVFLYDQRCHGYSERLTDEVSRIHVESFDCYVRDLEIFMEEIVLLTGTKPMYLYAHSMGGAVAVQYLAKHTDTFRKAVLSSPLFIPEIGGAPCGLAQVCAWLKAILMGRTCTFQKARRFHPEKALEEFHGAGRNRFRHALSLRCEEPRYQSTPLSSWWVYQSLCIDRNLKRKKVAERIQTPILLLSAGKDTVVRTEPHAAFADRCKACRLVKIDDALHSFMTSSDEVIERYVNLILDFY